MYRVKYDIGTAVSIGLVVGTHPVTGESVETEEIFLPGAILPANTAPRITKGVDNGEEHISKLVEKIDGRSGEAVAPEPVPPAQQQPEDVPGAPKVPDFPASDQPAIAAQQQSAGGGPDLPNAGAAGTVAADNPFAQQASVSEAPTEEDPVTPAVEDAGTPKSSRATKGST
jgi:hypothetical protein